MEIHHTKHHQTYVDKLNAGLEKYPEYTNVSIEELVKSCVAYRTQTFDSYSWMWTLQSFIDAIILGSRYVKYSSSWCI
jgi:superoxide dismutase